MITGTSPALRRLLALLFWVPFLLLALLLLPRLAQFAGFSAALLGWPWQFDYDEGINIHAAWLLAHGHNIYTPGIPDGFLSAPYPPLFYLANALILKLGGLSLLGGRMLSLLGTLAIGGLLSYLVRRDTGHWPAALGAAALWFSAAPVIIWSTVYKQDMVALALGIAGLAVLPRRPEERGARLYLAALLFAVAFWTKQSSISIGAAGALWLLLRDWRAGLRLAGALTLLIPLPFVLGNLLLGGGLFVHMIEYQRIPWRLDQWRQNMTRLAGEYWPMLLLGLAVGAALLVRALRAGWDPGRPLFARLSAPLAVVYAGVVGGALMLLMGYEGSNYNHLLDIFPPLCWLIGLGWANLALRLGAGALPRLALAGLLALLVAQSLIYLPLNRWYTSGLWPSPTRDAELRGISGVLAGGSGPVMSEDAWLALLHDRPLPYDDPSTFYILARDGLWDESAFIQDVRDRRFELVLLSRGSWRWTPPALSAFEESYELRFPGSIDVYVPLVYPLQPQHARACNLGSPAELRLAGYSLGPGVARSGVPAGETLRLALYWDVLSAPADYATFVHLLDDTGTSVAARDNPRSALDRPTSAWQPGEQLTELTDLPLPASLAPGRYTLIAGAYAHGPAGIQSLPTSCAPGQGETAGDAVRLGEVVVRAPGGP